MCIRICYYFNICAVIVFILFVIFIVLLFCVVVYCLCFMFYASCKGIVCMACVNDMSYHVL